MIIVVYCRISGGFSSLSEEGRSSSIPGKLYSYKYENLEDSAYFLKYINKFDRDISQPIQFLMAGSDEGYVYLVNTEIPLTDFNYMNNDWLKESEKDRFHSLYSEVISHYRNEKIDRIIS